MNGDEKYHMYEALDTITIRLRVQGIICTRKSGKTGIQAVQKSGKTGKQAVRRPENGGKSRPTRLELPRFANSLLNWDFQF